MHMYACHTRALVQGVHPAGLAKVQQKELREFIEMCINHDPEARPEARQLLKNPFFDSIRPSKCSCPGVDRPLYNTGSSDGSSDASSGHSEDEEQPAASKPSLVASDSTNMSAQSVAAAAAAAAAVSQEQQQTTPPLTPNGGVSRAASPLPTGLPAGNGSMSAPLPVANGKPPLPTPPSVGNLAEVAANGGLSRTGSTPPTNAQTSPLDSPGRAGRTDSAAALMQAPSAEPAPAAHSQQQQQPQPGSEADKTDREFIVQCKQLEESRYTFQLKFIEPEGEYWHTCTSFIAVQLQRHCLVCIAEFVQDACSYSACCWSASIDLCCVVCLVSTGTAKTIEFAFDSKEDTAECVASEMMEDLSLSACEARIIAAKISNELAR